jgi:hypothetical protein
MQKEEILRKNSIKGNVAGETLQEQCSTGLRAGAFRQRQISGVNSLEGITPSQAVLIHAQR